MVTALSADPLSIIEHLQEQLAELRQDIDEAAPLTIRNRALARSEIRRLVAALGNLKRTLRQPVKGDNASLERTLRHSPECMCSTCERLGAGYFAQRAALAGDPTAAQRLSLPVFSLLSVERSGKRRTSHHGR